MVKLRLVAREQRAFVKILIGVDLGGHYKSAVNMVARLRIDPGYVLLANCIDAGVSLSTYGLESAAYVNEYVRIANESGARVLGEATTLACTNSLVAESILLQGNPAGALMNHADFMGADLIAVQSERRSHLGSFTLGSVSRALAISSIKSVLITKGEIAPHGPLKIVFATDFSKYAKYALERFVARRPAGVESVKIVSALHVGRLKQNTLVGATFDPSRIKKIQIRVKEEMQSAVLKVKAAGYQCTGEIKDLPVNEAIEQAMDSSRADLLVMGAQGHGFMHRVVLGSTSLHQVVAEPYSVLIVRPLTSLLHANA